MNQTYGSIVVDKEVVSQTTDVNSVVKLLNVSLLKIQPSIVKGFLGTEMKPWAFATCVPIPIQSKSRRLLKRPVAAP